MTYEIEHDYDRGLFKIILSDIITYNQELFVCALAKIAETLSPMSEGIELAEYIKKFEPLTREERLHKSIDCEDTKLLQQQFPDSTLIDAVYSDNTHLIFKYLLPEDVMFLFEFGLVYDYDIVIKRREHFKIPFKEPQEMGEIFEVILQGND